MNNNVLGLIPLKIYSGSVLLTPNINQITITGSGINATIGQFNDLTITVNSTSGSISGSNSGSFSGSFTGSLLGTSSFAISASYAFFSTTASYALNSTPPFPYTGSARITGSLAITGSTEIFSGSNLIINNGYVLVSKNTSNTGIGGTPGWTTGLRNTAVGISNQSSITTQTDNTSLGYNALGGGGGNYWIYTC